MRKSDIGGPFTHTQVAAGLGAPVISPGKSTPGRLLQKGSRAAGECKDPCDGLFCRRHEHSLGVAHRERGDHGCVNNKL